MKTKKIILPESQMPTQWYNIVSDMKNRPLPPLNPATKEPVTLEQMSALFAEELMKQEMSTERYIDIPEEVQDLYKISTALPRWYVPTAWKRLSTPRPRSTLRTRAYRPSARTRPTPRFRRLTTTTSRESAI